MKVSIVMIARNEGACIGKVLDEIPRDIVDEIIIVDGHSTDNTAEESKKRLGLNDRFIIQSTFGYGGAFRDGIKASSGNVIIMMDADGSHNPIDIPQLLNKINEGYDYVMASRYTYGGKSYDDTFIRWFGNQFFTWLTNVVYKTNVTDSLYLYTAVIADKLKKINLVSDGFELCSEIVIKARRAGLRFTEVPATERLRFAGKSHVNAFWHGLKILKYILWDYHD